MLGFIAKKLLEKAAITHIQKSTKTLRLKTFASSATTKVDDFTASYLINSCGLQVDAARLVASSFKLKPDDQPDQALNFFKRCGFTDDEISNILTSQPSLLLADAELNLQSKFEHLGSLGIPLGDVLRLIHECPGILGVENLGVVLDVVKRLLHRGEEVLTVLSQFRGDSCSVMSNVASNVAVLRAVGVLDSVMADFLMEKKGSVFFTDPETFKEMTDRVLEMDFDPKEGRFVEAICAFAGVNGETWELRKDRFKKWGWSDEECDMVFKKEPRLLLVSEKKVNKAMDYLVNYLRVKPSVVVGCLNLLEYNIDKRILPLCSAKEFVNAILETPDRVRDKFDRALTKMLKTEKQHAGGASKPFDVMTVEAWETKVDGFKKWGWSHYEFVMAFRNQPRIILVSQEKIDGIMEFLVNKMGVDASIIAEHPNILKYSLENRIVPRCLVVEHLMSKGVVERKDHNIHYVLRISEETFVKSFVKKHEKTLPDLIDLYSQNQLTQ